ncbi:MAG TPA: hypothetical protein VJY33_06695 [Isosphaeraceae bacterium]|nr:hypothetical protein [Isosphaeraceae bacterium]
MFVASRSRSRRVGSPLCAFPTLGLLIVATPGATLCMAQGFGHGIPTPPPSIPHFTPQPSIPRFTPPSTGYRPSFRPPLSSGPSQGAMRGSIQNGINQSLRNDITQQQMLRNQMDTLRGTRDQSNRDRLNQENQRRIQDQINSLRQSLDGMNRARDQEQSRREVQAQIDRAQSELRRLQESLVAGGSSPRAIDFEERAVRAPARRRRARRGPEEPKAGQVPPAKPVDPGALAEQHLRMARGIEQAGNLKGALAYYQQVIDKHPGTSQALLAEQKIAELKQQIKDRKFFGLE